MTSLPRRRVLSYHPAAGPFSVLPLSRVAAALGLLYAALAAPGAPPAAAVAGYSFSLASFECPAGFASNGLPAPVVGCETTRDRAFAVTGPSGQSVDLTTTLQFGDDPPYRAVHWSPEGDDDLADDGGYAFAERTRAPETIDLVTCDRGFRGIGSAPAGIVYGAPGSIRLDWEPWILDPANASATGDGHVLDCAWYSLPAAGGEGRPGLLEIATANLAAPSLIAVEPNGEPFGFADPVPGEIPATTFTLMNRETGEATTLETAGGSGLADRLAIVLAPASYELIADDTGLGTAFELAEGQTVSVFAGLPTTAPPTSVARSPAAVAAGDR